MTPQNILLIPKIERGIVIDHVAGIDLHAIDGTGDGGLGQAGTDGLGDFHDTDGVFELAAAAVGERDRDHCSVPDTKKGAARLQDIHEAAGSKVNGGIW